MTAPMKRFSQWLLAAWICVCSLACASRGPAPVIVRGEGGREMGVLTGNQVFAVKLGCSLNVLDGEFYVNELRHIDVWWSGKNCSGNPSVDIGSLSTPVAPWEGFPFSCSYSKWADAAGHLRIGVFRVVQPVRRAKQTVLSRANFHEPLEECVNLDSPKQVQVYPLEQVPKEALSFQGSFTFGDK